MKQKANIRTVLEAVARVRASGPGTIACQVEGCRNMIPQDGLACAECTANVPDGIKLELLEACRGMLAREPGCEVRAVNARTEFMRWAGKGLVTPPPRLIVVDGGRDGR